MSATDTAAARGADATIRPMRPGDVDAADAVVRLAFGTFLGLPDPTATFGDSDMLRARYAAAADGAFVAERSGEVVGAVYATNWGSYGFFGPLAVHPQLWDHGIGSALLEPVMDCFERWGVRQAGLFTFAQSPKHVGLYQRFGFWPQHLTAVMARAPQAAGPFELLSAQPAAQREELIGRARELTGELFDGLALDVEIRAVLDHGFGDVVLVGSERGLDGFAVCHCRAGEATSDACYVKFAAVRPAAGGERFDELIAACESFAAARGAQRLIAGVNLARHDAYRRLLARGYRAALQGVLMQRPNDLGFSRADAHVLDDLR